MSDPAEPEDKFAEVLVGGHKHSLAGAGPVQHILVRKAGARFRHIKDIVTIRPQLADGLGIDALVRYEPHETGSATGYATSARRASPPNLTAASTLCRVSRGCSSMI